MASNERPRPERQETNPALTEAMFGVPVTPSISNEDKFPSFHHTHLPQEVKPHLLEAVGAQGAPEYGNGIDTNGSYSGDDVLRRLSLATADHRADFQDFDPRASHPNLDLSGNVISAAFCVPYKVGYTATGEWVGHTCSESRSIANTTVGTQSS